MTFAAALSIECCRDFPRRGLTVGHKKTQRQDRWVWKIEHQYSLTQYLVRYGLEYQVLEQHAMLQNSTTEQCYGTMAAVWALSVLPKYWQLYDKTDRY